MTESLQLFNQCRILISEGTEIQNTGGKKKHKNSERPRLNFCMWTPETTPLICCPLLLLPRDLLRHGDVSEGQLTTQSAFQLELQAVQVSYGRPCLNLSDFFCQATSSHFYAPVQTRIGCPSSVIPNHLQTITTFEQGCPHTSGHILHMVAAAGLYGKAM